MRSVRPVVVLACLVAVAGSGWGQKPAALTYTPATTLPPPAKDVVDIPTLNNAAANSILENITVDCLTRGVEPAGFGDGPSLVCFDKNGLQPKLLDFVVDGPSTDALVKNGLGPANATKVAARVTGILRKSPSGQKWTVMDVEEIVLFDPDFKPALTIGRGGKITAPPPPPREPGGADQIAALAADGQRFVGQQADAWVTILSLNAEVLREANGASKSMTRVAFLEKSGRPLAGVKIFLAPEIVKGVTDAYTKAGGKSQNAQFVVKVTSFDATSQETMCTATAVRFMDKEWKTPGFATSVAAVAPPPPSAPPEPPPPETPAAGFRPSTAPPPEPKDTKSGVRLMVTIGIIGVVVLLVLGAAGFWFAFLRTPSAGKKPVKKPLAKQEVDDADEEDEEEDERPRRKRR